MADKGFVIQDSLPPKLSNLREKGRITPSEVRETKGIAGVRIHVERVIG